jgi:hypothetical protein
VNILAGCTISHFLSVALSRGWYIFDGVGGHSSPGVKIHGQSEAMFLFTLSISQSGFQRFHCRSHLLGFLNPTLHCPIYISFFFSFHSMIFLSCNRYNLTLFPFFFYNFYYIFSSFTFQMLSQKSPIPSPCLLTPTSWPWLFPVLGHIKFARPRGLSSKWWPTKPNLKSPSLYIIRSMVRRWLHNSGHLFHCWHLLATRLIHH